MITQITTNTIKKYIVLILTALCLTAILTGCGHVKSEKQLYRSAVNKHGACEIVSVDKSNNSITLTLRDELQDFEYKISSQMNDISIDGSSFGTAEQTNDSFMTSLLASIKNNNQDELDAICDEYSITNGPKTMSTNSGLSTLYYIRIDLTSESNCKNAAKEVAKIYDYNNLKGRLDDVFIKTYVDDTFCGHYRLSTMEWENVLEANAEHYMEIVHSNISRKAKYKYAEEGTFGDTGLDLDRVVHRKVLNDVGPYSKNDVVAFYYFELDGKEYYICDFEFYLDDSHTDLEYYSNYYD